MLLSFLPDNWRDLAASTAVLQGLLRVLLIHLMEALLVGKLTGRAMATSAGDATWRQHRSHSAWRDLEFMWTQVVRTIEPGLSLG